MSRIITLALLALFCSFSYAVDVQICGQPSSDLTQVQISGCTDDDDVCPFNRGTNVTLNAQFDSEITSEVANVILHGIINGIPIPFNINPSNACGIYNLSCPLQPGQNYELEIDLPIRDEYPAWSLTVQLKLQDDHKKDILCFRFPAKIN